MKSKVLQSWSFLPRSKNLDENDRFSGLDEKPVHEDHKDIPSIVSRNVTKISKIRLAPVDLRFGAVREEDMKLTLEEAHKKVVRTAHVASSGKPQASVCFVVKRPGCVLCFEQGQALSELIDEFPCNQVAAWAVIKEINVDNEGLLHLYQNFFHFPFFLDSKRALYSVMGDRRITNPFPLFLRYREIRSRLNKKSVKGNMIGAGEGLLLGGVLIFNRKGELRYAHPEIFLQELPVDIIREALNRILKEGDTTA